jgi:sister-chromatid-cohesion protein PDS5
LIKAVKDRLHHYVTQYFHEIISNCDHSSANAAADKDVVDAHAIILELFAISDSVLLSVIPQLEAELKTEQTALRKLATEALGEMFAQRGSTLAKQYPNVWQSWLLK